MSVLGMLSGGYGHGRRIEVTTDEDRPPEPYVAADFGAKPAVLVSGADLQRIANAQAKRDRKAAKRAALLKSEVKP